MKLIKLFTITLLLTAISGVYPKDRHQHQNHGNYNHNKRGNVHQYRSYGHGTGDVKNGHGTGDVNNGHGIGNTYSGHGIGGAAYQSGRIKHAR